jgi:ketosteroid isomerase-like protein
MATNVEELVRFGYEQLWRDGDFDALLELADPDIVFTTSGAFPDLDAEYRGRDGMRRYWETIRGAFASLQMRVAHVVEHGDEILILFRFRGTSSSGLELERGFGQVGRMRDGLVTSIVAYPDWQSAAAAVGITLDEIG